VAIRDITADDVLGAIELLDDPARGRELLTSLHYQPARKYRLIQGGRFYDPGAVLGIAHRTATGEYLTSRQVNGRGRDAAGALERRGFFVDYGRLYPIDELPVDHSHGRPAPYLYVVLLWRFSRAIASKPRLTPFREARGELARLLAPFAIAKTAPDPAMPWLALRGELWELEGVDDTAMITEREIKSRSVAAGLVQPIYHHLSKGLDGTLPTQRAFAGAAVDVITAKIGHEPAYGDLLHRLGLADVGTDRSLYPGSGSPEVQDAIDAVEAIANPLRKRGGARLSAAENKAIESRAVLVAREHFEQEGYSTEDVGATMSYDVHATKGTKVVKIEVKGTTTRGGAVVLTRNEVDLHRVEHPNNALAVVKNIVLERFADGPVAFGGELVLEMPWKINESGLSPIAYDYTTGL